MAERGQRKSARLMALAEKKNKKPVTTVSMDVREEKSCGQSNLRKRGRKKKEAQPSQEAGASTNGDRWYSLLASRNPTDRVIIYILDMFDVKDAHELFSMPDNIQAYDYQESISNPADLATLRQKHVDGMYIALEHFEKDILTVFDKAIDSNDPDSIPFREAMFLRDQAKQIFQSLKNNFIYAELELSNWHQKYFKYKKNAGRNDGNVGTLDHAAQPECSSHAIVPNNLEQSGVADNVAASGNPDFTNDNPSTRRNPRPRARGRREAPTGLVNPKSREEQRRYTYSPQNVSDESLLPLVCDKPEPLVSDSVNFEDPNCQLHTEKLLDLFFSIGTPKILEGSLASSSQQAHESNQGFRSLHDGGGTQGMASTEPNSGSGGTMAQTGQCSNSKWEPPMSQSIYDLSLKQSRLSESKQWEQRGSAGPALYPSLAPEAGSSAGAGFDDHASCSFPSRPTLPDLNLSPK